jgi:hypothetical protein
MDTVITLLYVIGLGLLGYLSGSLPFSIWITRLFKGVDVRDSGSGHATTTNTIRKAGFGAGAIVLVKTSRYGLVASDFLVKFSLVDHTVYYSFSCIELHRFDHVHISNRCPARDLRLDTHHGCYCSRLEADTWEWLTE